MEGVFERAGLTPLKLTRAEAACAEKTPGIERARFIKEFGAALDTDVDVPQYKCSKVPGHGHEYFVCPHVMAQLFMPLSPGEPGLILKLPLVFKKQSGGHGNRDEPTFQLLSPMQPKGALFYWGRYTEVPLPEVQCTWDNLPSKEVSC